MAGYIILPIARLKQVVEKNIAMKNAQKNFIED
jgi:hypothetical protein